MANKLSFAVAINLLTENFKKGGNELKNGMRNIQMQAMAMFAVFAGGGLSLSSFVQNLIEVSRHSNRVSTALKNVSADSETLAKNQKFLIEISKKYGMYINDVTGAYTKFTAAATMGGMAMADQQKIFESVAKANASFGLTADESNGVFLALSQMMGKGTIQAQELKLQMGEKLPIALQAMAKAAGVSVMGLSKMMEQGKLTTAILPKFADELNKMTASANFDNIETSLNKFKNTFKELTDKLNVGGIYKKLIDESQVFANWMMNNFKTVGNIISNIISTIFIGKAFLMLKTAYLQMAVDAEKAYIMQVIAAKKSALQQELAGSNLSAKAQKKYIADALAAEKSYAQQAFAANKAANISTFAFAKIGVALKSAFASFAPLLILSALIAIGQKIYDNYQKQKEINNAFKEYQKGAKNAVGADTNILRMQQLLAIINNKKTKQDELNGAQNELNNLLGIEKGKQIDLTKEVANRIKLMQNQKFADYYTQKKVDADTENDNLYNKYGGESKLNKMFLNLPIGTGKIDQFIDDLINKFKGNFTATEIKNDLYKIIENKKISADAAKHSEKYLKDSLSGSNSGNGGNGGNGNRGYETPLQKAEKEYEDNLIELNNQFKNKVILEKEYNKQLDELNKKTYEKFGGLLNPKEAKKNITFRLAKNGVLNPLYTKQDEAVENLTIEQKKYTETLNQLNKKKELNLITNETYNDELNNLIDGTIDSILSIENIGDAANEYIKSLNANKKTIETKKDRKDDLSKYEYKSPFETTGKSEKEIAQINFENAKNELDKLRQKAIDTGDDLVNELNTKLKDVTSLDQVLKIIEVKDQIKDLKNELSNGLYSGVKDIASSAQRMFEAFQNVGDVLNDVDATGWEKFLSIWNALTNTVDSIMSVVSIIENLLEITNKLTAAKEVQTAIEAVAAGGTVANAGVESAAITAKAAVEIAASKAVTSAYSGQMAAATAAAYAPLMLAGVPLATAQIAGYEAMILAASIPKFADGGIVGGSSLSGDKLIARVNSGEMILNGKQQSTLFGLLNGRGGVGSGSGGSVEFKIDGKNLKGVLNNYDSIKSKTK